MMIIVLCIISVCLLSSLFMTYYLYTALEKKKTELKKLRSTYDKLKQNTIDQSSIYPGMKGIISDYGLCYKISSTKQEDFKITYEVDIVDVSSTKLKVVATGFTSTSSIGNDPNNKQGIIDFMNGKWVERNIVQVIMDEQTIRDIKFNELGIK